MYICIMAIYRNQNVPRITYRNVDRITKFDIFNNFSTFRHSTICLTLPRTYHSQIRQACQQVMDTCLQSNHLFLSSQKGLVFVSALKVKKMG
jgi:hypothetical protein